MGCCTFIRVVHQDIIDKVSVIITFTLVPIPREMKLRQEEFTGHNFFILI